MIICGGIFEEFRTKMGIECELIKKIDNDCVRALYKCPVKDNKALVLDMRHAANGFPYGRFAEGINLLKDIIKEQHALVQERS